MGTTQTLQHLVTLPSTLQLFWKGFGFQVPSGNYLDLFGNILPLRNKFSHIFMYFLSLQIPGL